MVNGLSTTTAIPAAMAAPANSAWLSFGVATTATLNSPDAIALAAESNTTALTARVWASARRSRSRVTIPATRIPGVALIRGSWIQAPANP